jgi:AcrR family transcriptional regulator
VTTAALAAELGISEGNIWYYFRTKRDLLEAISEEFVRYSNERLALRPSGETDVIEGYIELMMAHERELLLYRFLYRDQADYSGHSQIVLDNITGLYDNSRAQFKAFFTEMVRVGLLDWPEDRIDHLTVNAVILIRFGLEYFRETQQAFDSGAVEQTLLQHLTLFEHQLDPAAAKRLRDSAANRLPDAAARAA